MRIPSRSRSLSSRRHFLGLTAAAIAVVLLGVPSRGSGQDLNDVAATDESLKGRLIYYSRAQHDREDAGLFSYDFETRKFVRLSKDVHPDLICRPSPDGKSFAVTERNLGNEIASIIRPDGRTTVSDKRTRMFWSPDGRKVLVSEWVEEPVKSKTWLMDPDGTGRAVIAVPKEELVQDWSPDGRWVLVVRRNHGPDGRMSSKSLSIRKADGTEPRLLLENNPGGSGLGRFSPDSKCIAYVRIDHQKSEYSVRLIDVETGKERVIRDGDGQDDPDGNLCWSPDGKYLAVRMMDWNRKDPTRLDGHIDIIDLQGRRVRWLGIPQGYPVPCDWR